MRQLTITDVLKYLDELAEETSEAIGNATTQDETPTNCEFCDGQTTPIDEGTIMPKLDAIDLSIQDVILNTLQSKFDVTSDKADTLLKLAELRRTLKAV